MINLDSIISKMKENYCNNCSLMKATYDETGEEVFIYGSFCEPVKGHLTIHIIAKNIDTKEVVWEKYCETGNTCYIPFSSDLDFRCEF